MIFLRNNFIRTKKHQKAQKAPKAQPSKSAKTQIS